MARRISKVAALHAERLDALKEVRAAEATLAEASAAFQAADAAWRECLRDERNDEVAA